MKELTKSRTSLIIILVIIMALITPLKAAAAPKNQYVGDLYLAYGDDAEQARQILIDKGFTPIEGNMNDGGRTYAMLGYTTTDDIRYAVTDVAVMNMNGGYSVEEYQSLLKEKKSEIADFLEEFMVVVKEYRANHDAGKAKAKYVHDLLNKYTDDDTGMKLGDLFLADTLQDEVGIQKSITYNNKKNLPDLITILLQGNSDVIKSVEVLLSMATDTADDTWLDRFSNTTYDDLLDNVSESHPALKTEAKQLQYLDNIYGGIAQVIASDMANITDQLIGYKELGLDIRTATEDDIKKTFGDPDALEGEQAAECTLAIQDWMTTGGLYENLKKYEGGNFKKGELLDFFMEETDPDDVERLYRLVASLSEGQWYGLPFVTFEMLLKNAFADEENWKSQADTAKKTINGLEELSVYANIDRDIYKDDGSVALTDQAIRAHNTINGTTGDQMDALSTATAISWAATAIAGVVMIAAVGKVIYNQAAYSYYSKLVDNGWLLEKTDDISNELWLLREKRDSFLVDDDSSMSLILKGSKFARYAAFATIALGIISAILTYKDIRRQQYHPEQLPIPKYIVDNRTDAEGNNFSINYKAAECNREERYGEAYADIQSGTSADLLADDGQQWLVLYVSRNSRAGNPILADFAVQESSDAPSGLTGSLHLIGERGAVNVASGSFRNYSTFEKTKNLISEKTMYMFYGISDTPKTYDESAGNMTASTFNSSTSALFGFGGMVLGALLGAALAVMLRKKKETA